MSNTLVEKKCNVCEDGNVSPLAKDEIDKYLKLTPLWQVIEGVKIQRVFQFKGFYKTMAFVNAVAWVANKEGHHPDMEVSFNRCIVNFTTHAVDGLTDNDFICAAKVDQLFED
ncbi:4a-hydroxytetrahydrobiopterin dehydratase [Thiotrichales bacterium 19S3-7]|nr:4a-hydroxytetrahydrobiopterin dehydratase [Thiotrichales bacterium 19S3-7]MCF6801525.1 4a-hydroxytetrahydrobiopterin dehydratase [Thiotrichales bacterium 19S3-11]